MFTIFSFFLLLVSINFVNADDDLWNREFLGAPSDGDGMLGLSVALGFRSPFGCKMCSYNNNNNNGYSGSSGYSAPVYGNSQYTYGPVNQIQTVRNADTGSSYQNYANNYWSCVNNLRGQYYYSTNLGYYVCDVRANRYGK
uniref:Uncharacterized protein n=1 Tax=Panagrolaimus sp. PS1159 TaxID=55785 RepID=A0AC35F0T6_9BILA